LERFGRHAVEGVVAGEFGQLGAQLLGVAVLWTVILGLAYAFFRIQNAVMAGGIRVSEADELDGVDLPEMGALAYPEFEQIDVIAVDTGGISPTNERPDPDKVPV
jgi:Amt family ammonium transporter